MTKNDKVSREPPGTEICLENKRQQNFANLYLDEHIDEYPDFLFLGPIRYALIDKGEGQRLAVYRLDEDPDLHTMGAVQRLPAMHLRQPPRRRNDL